MLANFGKLHLGSEETITREAIQHRSIKASTGEIVFFFSRHLVGIKPRRREGEKSPTSSTNRVMTVRVLIRRPATPAESTSPAHVGLDSGGQL